ncbi:MAG: 4Fe-4S binding protein [Clostridia bacterium]|nr:4Fe-4S binding protein [Clostridia bacterium]
MKIKQWWDNHKPSKRRLIQLYAALLFNANLKGFGNGRIYTGPLKNICTPGLNCYSCPGASGACPLGALQNALGASNTRAPYYVIGIIMLYGLLLGRWICGFLCPFGLIQELLHKIPTPKLKKNRFTRVFSWLKYVILVLFVVILPLMYALRKVPLPAFCKYICPAGTLEGAMGLLSNKLNEDMLGMLGPLFTWKFLLLVCFVVACVFIYRFFCRFFCPLGALYGLFNRICFFGIKLDKPRCTDCGLCVSKCKMDIRHVGDHECISCGECISVCPTKAISWKGSKIFLAPDELGGEIAVSGTDMTEKKELGSSAKHETASSEAIEKKYATRRLAVKATAIALSAVLLISALVYYNFIDKAPEAEQPDEPDIGVGEGDGGGGSEDSGQVREGYRVGTKMYSADIPLINGSGELGSIMNTAEHEGKILIVNFWGIWCTPCIQELPHFDRIASEYKDSVTVLAIHSDYTDKDIPYDWIAEYYPETDMNFGHDVGDSYYSKLGGRDSYPMTLIADENGIVILRETGSITYEELKAAVDSALAKSASGAEQ